MTGRSLASHLVVARGVEVGAADRDQVASTTSAQEAEPRKQLLKARGGAARQSLNSPSVSTST